MAKLAGGLTLVAAALALSIGPAMAFESAFANVAKTVEGTPQQLAGIRQEILSMADSMPLAATKIAEVAATAGQLGIATQDVTAFTKVMVMLGTATDLSANQAATSMARFTNIMQIPITQLPLLAAALVHLGNNSAATESEILTLGLRLAAAGTQLGLSGAQVLALSAAMKSLGITAEVGGSSMSRVLIDMVTAAGPKMDTFARVIGVTRDEFKKLVDERSPEAAGKLVLGFVEGLQRIDQSGGSVRKVLQDLGLDSIRLRDTLIRLVAGGDQLRESFTLVSNASVYGGALLQEYGRFAETTASRLEILRNRLTGVAIDIGTPMLAGLAATFDTIGDAILRLQGLLGPAFSGLGEMFGNLVKVVGAFYDALGSPVLTGVTASLEGLAGGLAAVLGLFNSMGPAGAVLALLLVDLALVGPVTSRAVVALDGLAASIYSNGVAATAASVGLNLLKGALQLAPLALTVAGFYLLGKSMQDAKNDANELALSLSQGLAQSLEDGDYTGFANKIGDIQTRIDSLEGSLAKGGLNWRNFGQILMGTAQLFSPLDDKIIHNKAELEALHGVLDDPNFGGNFRFNIKELADDMGISEQAAFNLVAATGQLETAQKAGSSAYLTVKQAAKDYLTELQGLTGASREATGSLLDQQVSVQMLADLYGVSMATIQEAMARAKVTEEDLFDPKKYQEAIDKIDQMVGPWQDLANAVYDTDQATKSQVDSVRDSLRVTEELIAAQKRLADAFDQVKAARMAAEFPIENLRQATTAFEEATKAYKAGDISLTEYAQSLGELNAAQAAVAPSAQEAARMQRENAEAFRDTALAAKETDTAINEVLVRWGLLTATEVADLQMKGMETLDIAKQKIGELRESLHDDIVAQMAVDMGTTEADIERALNAGETWATSEFEARMKAATEGPMRDIAELLVQAGVWDKTEAEAYLSGNFADFETAMQVALDQARLWGSSNWVGIFTADVTDAEAREGGIITKAEEWRDGDWMAILSADNTDAVTKAEGAHTTGRNFADDHYGAQYTADDTDAVTKAAGSRSSGRFFADDTYEAQFTGDNSDSLSKSSEAADEGRRYADARYLAMLTGDNSDALNKAHQGKEAGDGFAKTYTATLDVRDFASGVIGAAAGLAAGFARTYTATLTTNNVTRYTTIGNNAMPIAQGAVLRQFAGGGVENHVAQIARGQWPVRVWAEPETGGEAYIPLTPMKRPRSTAILGTVAREFGYNLVPMASGGFMRDQASLASVMAAAGFRAMGSNRFTQERIINIEAPITLHFDGAGGLDEARVARLTEASVNRALSNLNRKLANARR